MDTSKQSQHLWSGVITLFFEKQDDQAKWLKFLEKATGNFKIKDFYSFTDYTDKKAYSHSISFDRVTELKMKYLDITGQIVPLDKVKISLPELNHLFHFERFEDALGLG